VSIDPATAAALAAPTIRLAVLAELGFANGPMRLWSGLGPLAWAGMEFTGAGGLAGISEISASTEIRANGFTLSLAGMPREMFAMLQADAWKNRPAKLWLAVFDDRGELIGEPLAYERARMDQITVELGESVTFALTVETEAVAIGRAPTRRYTAEDQRNEHPGDAAFDTMASLQGRTILWGVAEA
jgi:hypothetical protein